MLSPRRKALAAALVFEATGSVLAVVGAGLRFLGAAIRAELDDDRKPDPAPAKQRERAQADAHGADVDPEIADAERLPLDELLRTLVRPGVHVEAVRVGACACCGALVVGDRVHCRTCRPDVPPIAN